MQVTGWGADPGQDGPPPEEPNRASAAMRLATATSAPESRVSIALVALLVAALAATIGGFCLSLPIGFFTLAAAALLISFLYSGLIGRGES